MITKKVIVDKIATEVRLPTMTTVIGNEVSQAYYEVCERVSWLALRKTIDLDFSTIGTAAGLYLPADLIGIDAVVDASTLAAEGTTNTYNIPAGVIEFLPRDASGMAENEDYNYRWYYTPNQTPLDDSDSGMKVTRLSTVVAFTTTLGGDRSGEWIGIKGMVGFCKLVNNTTLLEGFPGTTNTSTGYGYQVRPVGQRMLTCVDTLRGAWTGTVRVFYWAYPQPLIADGSPVVVPARLVELLAFARVAGTYGRREQTAEKYRKEFEAELDKQLMLNPKFGRRAFPRDKYRRPLTFKSNLFMAQGRNYAGGR